VKTLPDNIATLMSNDTVVSFLLITLGPDSDANVYRFTTLPYDYTKDGDVFISGYIQAIDPPKVSDHLDKGTFRLTLADPGYVFRAVMENGKMTGSDFIVEVGFINNTGADLDMVSPDQPLDEYITAYKGQIDSYAYVINTDEEVLLTLEGASPMGSLDLKRSLLTSKNYQDQKFSGDISYDELLEGSSSVVLLWGKAP